MLKGLWEIPWGLLGTHFSKSLKFLHLWTHCHHTNDHIKPFGLIQCPSRDIVWKVWFYELICGVHRFIILCFLIFFKGLIFSVLLTFSQTYLHHSVSCGVFHPIKVTILNSICIKKSLNTPLNMLNQPITRHNTPFNYSLGTTMASV